MFSLDIAKYYKLVTVGTLGMSDCVHITKMPTLILDTLGRPGYTHPKQ